MMQMLAHVGGGAPSTSPLHVPAPCHPGGPVGPFPGASSPGSSPTPQRVLGTFAHPIPFHPCLHPIPTLSHSAKAFTCRVSGSAALLLIPPTRMCAGEPLCATSRSPPPRLQGGPWCPPPHPAQRPLCLPPASLHVLPREHLFCSSLVPRPQQGSAPCPPKDFPCLETPLNSLWTFNFLVLARNPLQFSASRRGRTPACYVGIPSPLWSSSFTCLYLPTPVLA